MKRSIKIKPEGIMNLHEARRYVSAPDPAAEEHEYILNLYHDALERGIIPPDTSIERFRKELHDFDYGSRRKQTPTRYAAKDEKPRFDLHRPIRPQDFHDWAITLGTLDQQSLDSIRFILDKLQEQNRK